MKTFLSAIAFGCICITLGFSAEPPGNVQKDRSNDQITGNLVVGNGMSIIPSGSGIITATSAAPEGAAGGDLTGTYPNPALSVSGVSAGTYGSSTETAVTIFDAKGRATSSSNTTITPSISNITGLGTGVSTALAASANSVGGFTTTNGSAALTNKTYNGNTLTAGTGTLTIGPGKTFTSQNTLTFTGTDGSSVNLGTGGTVLYSGGSYVSSLAGTANEITASASTGAVTLSLPSSLTFTGKTITGGTFSNIVVSGAISTFSGSSVTDSGLTSGRVTFAGASGLLTDDSDMTFATDTLTVTKATIGGISHVANAITAANSVTANTTTDLTLAGGSSGASLVLGQGASGIGTFNRNVYTSGGALLAAGNIGSPGSIGLVGFIDTSAGLVRFGAYNFTTAAWQPLTLNSGGGNVLLGGTTDISGSGGLKVFGTTAATSTTTGAFQIGGGTAATGIGIGGGAVYAGAGYFNVTNSRLNTATAAYGAGTAYSLTNTPAAIDFGTTDPIATIPATGTYTVTGAVNLLYNAATFAGTQTVTLKFRRTNNTAADLTNGSMSTTTQIITALTYTYGEFRLPDISYAGTAGDIITIFADVTATPGAGSLDAVASGTWIRVKLDQ